MVKCCLLVNSGLQSLYVDGLGITISFRIPPKIDEKKVKNIGRLMNRLKKAGIIRVTKPSYIGLSVGGSGKRWFEVKHSDIIELLDEQGYDVNSLKEIKA